MASQRRTLTGNVTCCLFRIQTNAVALEWHRGQLCDSTLLPILYPPFLSIPSTSIIKYPHGLRSIWFCQFSTIWHLPDSCNLGSIAQTPFNSLATSPSTCPAWRPSLLIPKYAADTLFSLFLQPQRHINAQLTPTRCGCVVLTCACARGTA